MSAAGFQEVIVGSTCRVVHRYTVDDDEGLVAARGELLPREYDL